MYIDPILYVFVQYLFVISLFTFLLDFLVILIYTNGDYLPKFLPQVTVFIFSLLVLVFLYGNNLITF